MSVSVSMPQLGESVTEGTVTRWLKKEGERVEADEPLLEVSTDKVDTEIPSPAAGVLREIAVGEDETVEVGAQLAVIEEGDNASGGEVPAADGGQPAQASAPAQEAPPQQPPAQQAPQAQAPAQEPAPQPGGYGGDTPDSGTNGAASPSPSSAPAPPPAPPGAPPQQAPPPPPLSRRPPRRPRLRPSRLPAATART